MNKCICCGKKVGLLSGSNLNNQICDTCYYPVAGYLNAIKQGTDFLMIEEEFREMLKKMQSLSYLEEGKAYLKKYAESLVKDVKDRINTEIIREQAEKDFKITTSNQFEGYRIVEYHGITSGSTVLGTGIFSELNAAGSDLFGTESDAFSDKLEQARKSSVKKLISNAINQGGNALISVSFDYVNFVSNMVGVVANGTIVEIAKCSDGHTCATSDISQ